MSQCYKNTRLMRCNMTKARIFAVASLLILTMYNGVVQAEMAGEDNPANSRYHRLDNGWRFSPLDQLNRSNVSDLKTAWIHQVGDIANSMQATPMVLDGVIYYVGSGNSVFAVNGKTGETIWHYQPELDPVVAEVFYTKASGCITAGHGNVYLGTLDGRFIAIDQKTGNKMWSTQITNSRECFACLF